MNDATRYIGILSEYEPAGYGFAMVLNGNPDAPPEQIFVHYSELVNPTDTMRLGDTLSFEVVAADERIKFNNPRRRAAKVHIVRSTVTLAGDEMCPCCRRVLPSAIKRNKIKQELLKQEARLKTRFGEKYVPSGSERRVALEETS